MKAVIVTVETDGTIEIKATGFRGSACEKATAQIEKALGTVTKKTRTPEFYQGQEQQQKAGQG